MALITQAEYARRSGVSRPAVAKWKRRGMLVMNGDLVDVEASDAYLKKYRRGGLPEPSKVARKPDASPVQLQCADIVAKLESFDWKRTFDWSDDEQVERVHRAAHGIGCIAMESDLRDDGHWGGFQIRKAGSDDVVGGYGFELDEFDALRLLREEVQPLDADDVSMVIPDLLPLLAHPWSEWDNPKT